MYWSAWSEAGNQQDGQIVRTSMDGTGSTKLFDSSQVVWPNALALDYQSQTLYFIDALKDTISRSRVDGSNHEVILDLNNTGFIRRWHSFGLDYFNDDLYFGDWFDDSILTFNVNSPGNTLLRVMQTDHDVGDIRVVDPLRQPAGESKFFVLR